MNYSDIVGPVKTIIRKENKRVGERRAAIKLARSKAPLS